MSERSHGTSRLVRRLQWVNKTLAALGALAALVIAGAAWAAEPSAAAATGGTFWGLLSAALAVGLGCIGAGYAVAHIGAAAMGAVSERPELAGRTLIFVGLAEGIAIYGLIVAVMILGRL